MQRCACSLMLVCALSACAADDAAVEDDEVSTVCAGLQTSNRLSSNRLATNRLATNRLATNRLAPPCRSTAPLELDPAATDTLIVTPEGRELLTYTVGCALPAGERLVGEHHGVQYEFEGEIGLAPGWASRALQVSEQRWISACLLARVNAHGQSVEISMRGAHPVAAGRPDRVPRNPVTQVKAGRPSTG